MPSGSDRHHYGKVTTLVGDQAHWVRPSLSGSTEHDFLVRERVGGIAKRGVDIVSRQPRIGLNQTLLVRPFPNLRTINSTGIRVPRITGLPSITFGLSSIRS